MRPIVKLSLSILILVSMTSCATAAPTRTPAGTPELSTPTPARVLTDTPASPTATSPPCPVTAPNGRTPPNEQPSAMYYGNGQIWTVLWPEGVIRFEPGGPGEIRQDGSMAMKFPWWRGKVAAGALRIEGERLDGHAPPLQADIPEGYGETGFQATGLIFPSEGCWQVTARAGQAELTIVTQVVKVD